MKRLFFCVLAALAAAPVSGQQVAEPPAEHAVRISAGDLTAVFSDNSAFDGHRAWYNGVASLVYKADTLDIFKPEVAGLNFEHIFDGQKWGEPAEALFEPRSSAMEIRQLSENSVELHMPPSSLHKLESWTVFKLSAPHYIDMEFSCIPRDSTFDRGYIGLFWASYINTTVDKAYYFVGKKGGQGKSQWVEYLSPAHTVDGTVRYEKDRRDPTFIETFRPMLYNHFSPDRYSYPFYYGRRGEMAVILMFDQAGPIRFSHSPTSGSPNGPGTYPAWDFQYLVFDYKVGQKYGFKARLAYKPFVSRQDIIAEYEKWSGKKVKTPK